jgi:hypothetical protein
VSGEDPREHRFALEIEDGRIWRLSVECPYDLDDKTRPCWPYDEGGQRMEDIGEVCTIIDWSEAVSPGQTNDEHGNEAYYVFECDQCGVMLADKVGLMLNRNRHTRFHAQVRESETT